MFDSFVEFDVFDWLLLDNDFFELCDDVCKKFQYEEIEVLEVMLLVNVIKYKCIIYESYIFIKKIEKKFEKIYKFKIENVIYK